MATMQVTSGIPKSFWRDDYILGFIGFTMMFHITKTSPVKVKEKNYSEVMVHSFENLSLQNGLILTKRFHKFFTESEKPPIQFIEGMQNASLFLKFVFGASLDSKDRERIASIKKEKGAESDEMLPTILMEYFFYDVVKTLA